MIKLRTVTYNACKIFMLVMSFSAFCLASGDIPESITFDQLHNLYEPVLFEHQLHADMLPCSSCHHHLKSMPEEENSCTRCHLQENTQTELVCQSCHLSTSITIDQNKESQKSIFPFYHLDIPTLKGALHLQCVGCHRIDGGPIGCRECHAFTEQGIQRFQVKR